MWPKFKFKRANIPKKLMLLEIPDNMHINTLCLQYLKSFTKFHAVVLQEMCLQKKQDWLTDEKIRTFDREYVP